MHGVLLFQEEICFNWPSNPNMVLKDFGFPMPPQCLKNGNNSGKYFYVT